MTKREHAMLSWERALHFEARAKTQRLSMSVFMVGRESCSRNISKARPEQELGLISLGIRSKEKAVVFSLNQNELMDGTIYRQVRG